MNSTPVSNIRRESRAIIVKVIDDNVRGPVQCLPQGDVLELRKLLRDAYPFQYRKGWEYKVWCQEVRFALGYAIPKIPRYEKLVKRSEDSVMPAMREWARERGILYDSSTRDPSDREGKNLTGQVILEVRKVGAEDSWIETYDASDLTDPYDLNRRYPNRRKVASIAEAREWARILIREFNGTLRDDETPREVVSVRFMPAI